jgi:hypothetical protein
VLRLGLRREGQWWVNVVVVMVMMMRRMRDG